MSMMEGPVLTARDVIKAINEMLGTEIDREFQALLRGDLSTEQVHTRRGRIQAIQEIKRKLKSQYQY